MCEPDVRSNIPGVFPMKQMSLRIIAAVVLAAGALAVADRSFAFAQNAAAPEQPRSDQHPRKTAATDRDPSTVQIKPTDREKAVDRRINNICRGC
jgi:hypothetical protein